MTNTVNRSDSMYFHITASKASEFIGLFQLTLQALPPPVCPELWATRSSRLPFYPHTVLSLNVMIALLALGSHFA